MLQFNLPKISFPLKLLLVLFVIFLLRVPSLFEPYWYGDEGIYLVLGQSMQRGALLYRDIWDNKPPLLYVLYAISPTLLWAKALAIVFVLGTCVGVYALAKSLLKNTSVALLATLVTGILLSIPKFEGTIANAELFFTLPIVWGAYLLLINEKVKNSVKALFSVGILASLAFLFKVPALFDFLAMFTAVFFIYFWPTHFNRRIIKKDLFGAIKFYGLITLGFLLPFAITCLYFISQNGLMDFLTGSFVQNASYVSVDSGPFSSLNNPLFIKGIVLLVITLVLIVGYLKRLITKELLFLSLWFGFSLYGALLSNRPYMHYLLQVLPPLVLLVFYLLTNLLHFFKERKTVLQIIPGIVVIALVGGTLLYLNNMFKSAFALGTQSYYSNWFDFISERKTWEDYVTYFDSRTLNSYAMAEYLKANSNSDDSVFVWSDASFVYVLSNRAPATKFIQAHHLSTIDPKNFDSVAKELEVKKPRFILIARPVHFEFQQLEKLVEKRYQYQTQIGDMYFYELASFTSK